MQQTSIDLQAIARHQWQYILSSIGIEQHYLRDKHQSCPLCGGKDRYRFDDKDGNGTYYCNQCGAGNGYTMIQKHLGVSFPEAAQIVKNLLGYGNSEAQTPTKPIFRQPESDKHQQAAKDRLPRLMRIWHDTEPLNDFAKRYLSGRGLNANKLPETAAIRFIRKLDYWTQDSKGKPLHITTLPAIVAAITDQAGQMQGLHLTYLHQRETGQITKARLLHPETHQALPSKKMQARFSGSLKGASVQIEQPNQQGQIIIAEGIETALAARELFGLPCMAALSANGLQCVNLPAGVTEVLIAADNDIPRPVGYEAALHLAARLRKQGITARIWQSQTQGHDALDELNGIKAKQPEFFQSIKKGIQAA